MDSHDVFSCLSDPNRLAIVLMLAKGKASVGDICKSLKLAQPTVSHHLMLLRVHGFVENDRCGRSVMYRFGKCVKIHSNQTGHQIVFMLRDLGSITFAVDRKPTPKRKPTPNLESKPSLPLPVQSEVPVTPAS